MLCEEEMATEVFEDINCLLEKIQDIKNNFVDNLWEIVTDRQIDEKIGNIEKYSEKPQRHLVKIFRKMHFREEIISIRASLKNIRNFVDKEEFDKAYKKIQYELIPLIENMRMHFYYFMWIDPNPQKKEWYYENVLPKHYRNPYVDEAKISKAYKYDLSIIVTGYNKLEYTKICIQSLLIHLPTDISYEIILVNHGSTDGTKKYFESLNPDKQIDIEVNGGGYDILDRIVEGRYVLRISNDVLITDNAIENLYRCIKSNDNIAWVVPTTPNVSNNQTIQLQYSNVKEMFIKARENNISDDRRWEEKNRLCNPVEIFDIEKKLKVVCGRVDAQANGCFIDDKTSMLYRRSGYKMILAKDAYCYHFGSVTIGDELSNEIMAKFFTRGRIEYIKEWGMDPWGYGNVYDAKLFDRLKIDKHGEVSILGINSGLGATVLKLKNIYKEKLNNRNVWITSMTDSRMNEQDLKGISDEMIVMDDWNVFQTKPMRLYDYILIENGVDDANIAVVNEVYKWKKQDGIILLRVENASITEKLWQFHEKEALLVETGYCWIRIK